MCWIVIFFSRCQLLVEIYTQTLMLRMNLSLLVMNSYLRGIDWSLLEFMNSYLYFCRPSWTNMIQDKFQNPNSPSQFSTLIICQKIQLFFILVGINLYLWDTNSSKKPYTPLRIFWMFGMFNNNVILFELQSESFKVKKNHKNIRTEIFIHIHIRYSCVIMFVNSSRIAILLMRPTLCRSKQCC